MVLKAQVRARKKDEDTNQGEQKKESDQEAVALRKKEAEQKTEAATEE
jgi:hypothetical protein